MLDQSKLRVTDKDGNVITEGSEIVSFRGETHIFKAVSGQGRTGTWKVWVDDGWGDHGHEYNYTVYDLTIEELGSEEPRSIAHNANARTGVYFGELCDV